jgi:hypothetical protein
MEILPPNSTQIGTLSPHDRLLIWLQPGLSVETLSSFIEALKSDAQIFDQCILFSGDVVQSLTVVQAPPLDTDTIVDGSRVILQEMKQV